MQDLKRLKRVKGLYPGARTGYPLGEGTRRLKLLRFTPYFSKRSSGRQRIERPVQFGFEHEEVLTTTMIGERVNAHMRSMLEHVHQHIVSELQHSSRTDAISDNEASSGALTLHTAMLSEQLWEPPPLDLVLLDDEVHVWRVVLDLPASSLRRLHSVLAADEIDRAGCIQDAGSRNRFIAARGQFREILCRYLGAEPDQLRFCYGPSGKPSLAATLGAGALTFNLAHSQRLALCAVARGRELGVDLERIRLESGWEQMARQYLSASERATLRALPTDMRCAAFFRYWTCKEAYLKAIGAGLSQALREVEVGSRPDGMAAWLCGDAGAHWSLHTLAPGAGYVGALVVEGHGSRLRCWQWPAQLDGY